MGRFIAIIWALATVVVNVAALAALLGGIGLAPSAWNPPFDAIGQIYDQAVRFSFSAIAGPIESRTDWCFPWWSGHAAAIYAATASAILALSGGVARRESLIEAANSGGLSLAWPVAVAAFLWQAARLRIVTRFAREHALALVGYFVMVGGAYAGARSLNENFASDAPSETRAAHVAPATVDWRAEALANIDAAGLDDATASAWQRYAAVYDAMRPAPGGVLAHTSPVSADHIVDEATRFAEPPLLIGVQAQGDDPRPAEWERLNTKAEQLYAAGDFKGASLSAEQALKIAESVFGKDHPNTLTTVNNLAVIYQAQGRLAEAEPFLKRAIDSRERVLGKTHIDTLASLSDLAALHLAQGRYVDAERLYKSVIATQEREFGIENPTTIRSINGLGAVYYAQSRFREAEALFIRAFAASERALGKDHPTTLASINNLATLYQAQGRFADAEPLLKRVLETRERVFGKDHPSTLFSVNSLAALFTAQGRYAEAERLFKRALAGFDRALGKEHPLTLSTANNLAANYQEQGRYSEAEPLYKRVLETRSRLLGAEHPSTIASINNLASLYQDQGRYDEAEPLKITAQELGEKVLGKENRSTLLYYANLASLYLSTGRFNEAASIYEFVLKAREKVLGRDHPDTLQSASDLASTYWSQGRYTEAEPFYLRALQAKERVLGNTHPSTLISLNNLAFFYSTQGRYAEAESLYVRALDASVRVLGKEHPFTITVISNLAALYNDRRRFAEAEPLYIRALAARERVLGKVHPDTLTSVNNLAGFYRDRGRYGEAEPLQMRALTGFKRALGEEHPLTITAYSNLGGLYLSQGRFADAGKLFEYALQKRALIFGKFHRDTLSSLETYFLWRRLASVSGIRSNWPTDSLANELLGEAIREFAGSLAQGIDPARLSEPTSVESLAAQLFSSFQLARLGGVRGSDGAKIVSDASALSQRFNLSSVATALSASSLRLADPKRRALLDERTRLGREIDDRYKALAKLQSAERRIPAGEASIQADIDGLAKEAAAITAQLRAGDQGQAEIDGVIVEEDLAKVGAALRPDEALIAYSSVGGRYLAFVTTRKGSTAVALGVERDEIAKQVTELRKGLRLPFTLKNGKEIASDNSKDLPPFDLALANTLYAQLVAPLGSHLAGIDRLVIIPDGPLQSFPFGVLVESSGEASANGFERYKTARFLIDRYAVSMQPSVSAIRALRAKTPRARGDLAMLGFADPALSGKAATAQLVPLSGIGDAKRLEDLPELPQMRSLLTVVGSALGARPEDLRFREKAQEADFRGFDATLPRYRMLTFATHGLVSNEIKALNLDEPALVMSLPPAKAGQKRPPENDGLLKASDIVGFDMDADLVILAACNTAAADGTPGAEPLSGLAKAFMARGARALLVSHWQAEAYSSAVLIPAMARYAEEDGFSEGLAKAQRDMRKNAAFDPDPLSNTLHYAHPAIWGAFTLIGDPGR